MAAFNQYYAVGLSSAKSYVVLVAIVGNLAESASLVPGDVFASCTPQSPQPARTTGEARNHDQVDQPECCTGVCGAGTHTGPSRTRLRAGGSSGSPSLPPFSTQVGDAAATRRLFKQYAHVLQAHIPQSPATSSFVSIVGRELVCVGCVGLACWPCVASARLNEPRPFPIRWTGP